MKNYSRRKFVETTVIGGVGAGIFQDWLTAGKILVKSVRKMCLTLPG